MFKHDLIGIISGKVITKIQFVICRDSMLSTVSHDRITLTLIEGDSGEVQAAGDVAVESQQRSCGKDHKTRDYNDDNAEPLADRGLLHLHILSGFCKDPYTLGDGAQQVEDEQKEQSHEKFIVERTNAVIQENAMMVEILSTSVATFTMVALLVHVRTAQVTVSWVPIHLFPLS